METDLIRKLAFLLKVDVFRIYNDELTCYQDHHELSPLYQNESLRVKLMEQSRRQTIPVVIRDSFSVYFACIKQQESYYLLGPMATEYLNIAKRHAFYKENDVKQDMERNLQRFTYAQMLQSISAFAELLTGKKYSDVQLMEENHLAVDISTQEESIRFDIASDEETMYRHTYQEERRLLDAVRNGDPEEALRRVKSLDGNIGKLGENDLQHLKNLLVIGATLCARAAIEGGVAPYVAYRISGFYINRGSASHTALHIIRYRNEAVEVLAGKVRELKEKKHASSYTMQCKDYVNRHYREKIYLDKIADQLGISPSYLSRLFKKEAGQQLQEYITDVRLERAKNLLVYSDESLARIAEYVNFPSQSYFGRVFKEKMNMTPRAYREQNKPKEFIKKKS